MSIKRSKRIVLPIALALVVFWALSGMVVAQTPGAAAPGQTENTMPGPGYGPGDGFGPGPGYGYGNGYMAGLTPEKQAAAQKIFAGYFENMAKVRQQLDSKRYELYSILATPNPDVKKVEAVSKEIGTLMTQIDVARANLQNQLTNEGLPPMLGKHHYGMGPGKGGGWGHGGRGHGRGQW